jgi:N12 class adenine-specific DNA methylase
MEPIIDSSKALLQAYFMRNAEFIAMLDKRTSGEIAYDSEVVAGLKNGVSIEQALKAAGEKNPEEALKWDKGTIESIGHHYKFLRGHEEIVALHKYSLIQEKRKACLRSENSFLLSQIKQLEGAAGKPGRNEPCPAGAGRNSKNAAGDDFARLI